VRRSPGLQTGNACAKSVDLLCLGVIHSPVAGSSELRTYREHPGRSRVACAPQGVGEKSEPLQAFAASTS
jgi:hypothetical protein